MAKWCDGRVGLCVCLPASHSTYQCYWNIAIALCSVYGVCLSVCHKSAFYRNGWTNRAGFRRRGFSIYHTPRCKKIRVFILKSPEALFWGTLCQILGSEELCRGTSTVSFDRWPSPTCVQKTTVVTEHVTPRSVYVSRDLQRRRVRFVILGPDHRHRIDTYLDTLLANQPISDGEAMDL